MDFSNAKFQQFGFTLHTGWVTTGMFYLSDLLLTPYKAQVTKYLSFDFLAFQSCIEFWSDMLFIWARHGIDIDIDLQCMYLR